LNEQILSNSDQTEIDKLKELNILPLNNIVEKNEYGVKELNENLSKLKEANALDVLKYQNKEITDSLIMSSKQKKANIQIAKYITKYVIQNFGKQKNVFNLNPDEKKQLEGYIANNIKLNKLNLIKEGQKIVNNSAKAAWWESCTYETSFPDWATYQDKSWLGYKANWVGRTSTDEAERSGISPCDFSFYLGNPRISQVDGWSIATACAVKWSNGISIRRYGWDNMKAIIGHGRLTACGVFSFNTEMLRDQIRFY
jgi:hypothetical protein